MFRVVVELDVPAGAEQGMKEKLAADFERYGDVRIVEVREAKPEQMKLEG